ncbi:MAG: hypothetical protein V1755_03795 [Chloroflexota bacterium]
MQWKERNNMVVLMALHLLWGLVLWFSISKYGLGVSTDGVHQLFGGFNLASGNGLTSYDGQTLILWPPLYPVLLALVRWITGREMLGAAAVVQAVAFIGLALALAILFLRIFDGNLGLAIAGTVLAQAGSVVVIAFGMVGADYFHLFLVVLLLVLTGHYVQSGSGRAFVALAWVGILATMQRYLGVAAVATAALTIVALAQEGFGRRLWNGLVLCSTALPMAVWLAITSQSYTRRGPISLAENFSWFSRSILEWFLGPISAKQGLEQSIALLWLVLFALVAITLVDAVRRAGALPLRQVEGKTRRTDSLPYLFPLLLYGACYTLALFGSASMAYFNKLGGRFLLPLYVPVMALPILAAGGIMRRVKGVGSAVVRTAVIAGCYIALAGLAVIVLRTTYPLIIMSHAEGAVGGENAFNTREWRENPAIQFWLDRKPEGNYVLFSNEPDGVAFHTQYPTRPAPRRTAGPYGTQEMPISDFRSELFGSANDVYLVWLEPNPHDYYYGVDELKAIASVETLFRSKRGSVYQLRPPAEQ